MLLSHKLVNLIRDPDVAIDLGTANTRLFASGKGLVADVPTVIEADHDLASARQLSSKEKGVVGHSESSVAPLRGGVITDIQAASTLIGQFLRSTRRFGLGRARAIACAPTDASPSEVAALHAAVYRAGVSSLKVVPEPLAAAVGAGLDTSLPYAQALIDIGAGVTDIAVIRSGVLINTAAVRLGCDSLYPEVHRMVTRHYGVVLFAREAERLMRKIGLVHRSEEAMAASPPLGLDNLNGHERSINVSGEEVADAVRPIINVIMETIRRAFSNLPPDVAAEVIESGICLTGGGACLPGMRELIAEVTSIEVKVAAEPLHAVINGASQMLAVGERTGLWNDSNQRGTLGTGLSEGCAFRAQ